MVLLAVSSGWQRGVQQQSMQCVKKSCWENFCEMSYVLNFICYGSNGMQLMLTQHRFPCKFSGRFQADPLLVLETSPDLLPPDLAGCCYFHWGYVKSKIHETRPVNIDGAKQPITEWIQRIPMEILKSVTPSLPRWLQECTERHSCHLHDVSFKQQW
jgi:hypothetical protein